MIARRTSMGWGRGGYFIFVHGWPSVWILNTFEVSFALLKWESLWTLQRLRSSVACIGACSGRSTVMLIFPVCQLCACGGRRRLSCVHLSGGLRARLAFGESRHHSRTFRACFGADNWTTKSLVCFRRLQLQERNWNFGSILNLCRRPTVYKDRMIYRNLPHRSLIRLSLSSCS